MESLILILVILGTFLLGYVSVNLVIRFFEGTREGRNHCHSSYKFCDIIKHKD